MGAFLFAKLLSPKGLLIGAIIIAVSFALYSTINFVEKFDALEQQNTTLQQNLTVANAALSQEKKAAQTQKAEDDISLDSVRQHDATVATQFSEASIDNAALQALGAPTSEDNKCVSSRYVATVLNSMRSRAAVEANGSSGTGADNAPAPQGTHNAGS
jgi:hypothetical protein